MISKDEMKEIENLLEKKEEPEQQQPEKKKRKPREAKVDSKKENKEKDEAKVKEIKAAIINIDELSKEGHIENSDVILAIIEVAVNSELYNINQSNKSRHFWDTLNEKPQFENLLKIFKTETLRKYWRIISEISSTDKLVATISKYKDDINKTSMKILTIITSIKAYLSGKIKDFSIYLQSVDKPGVTSGVNRASRAKAKYDDDDESFEDPKLLNQKREKNSKAIEELNKIATEVRDDETKRRTRQRNVNNSTIITSIEQNQFNQIDTIVETFKSQLPELEESEIWEALKKNSFNIISTYQYLNDPISNELYCFNDEDDYVLRNFQKGPYYKRLLEEKGKDRIEERMVFLDIDFS